MTGRDESLLVGARAVGVDEVLHGEIPVAVQIITRARVQAAGDGLRERGAVVEEAVHALRRAVVVAQAVCVVLLPLKGVRCGWSVPFASNHYNV